MVRSKQYWQPWQSTKLREVPRCLHAPAINASHRWGVVLADGDGRGLRELTQKVWGDRPKQFCPILSACTLLEETRHRAERIIPREQILFSVLRAHERYYRASFGHRASPIIVQPFHMGTAPAILSSLLHIAKADADAIVSIFPGDHYYSPESAFRVALESALEIAEQRTSSLILLSAEPREAETQYGWIEIGDAVGGHTGVFQVQGFYEKPPLALAEGLLRSGSLWNTFIIVGRVRAFLEMASETVPGLLQALESTNLTSRSRSENYIPEPIYARIAPVDFSRNILALATHRLLAFRLTDIEWNDLGNPDRVLGTLLVKNGDLPVWTNLWFEPESARGDAAVIAAGQCAFS